MIRVTPVMPFGIPFGESFISSRLFMVSHETSCSAGGVLLICIEEKNRGRRVVLRAKREIAGPKSTWSGMVRCDAPKKVSPGTERTVLEEQQKNARSRREENGKKRAAAGETKRNGNFTL